MEYKGYTIEKSGDNYIVKTPPPSNTRWAELAVNLATAKKWVDADLNEKRVQAEKKVMRAIVRKVGDEWIVFAYDGGGRRMPEADYFTPDHDDALETARKMVPGY